MKWTCICIVIFILEFYISYINMNKYLRCISPYNPLNYKWIFHISSSAETPNPDSIHYWKFQALTYCHRMNNSNSRHTLSTHAIYCKMFAIQNSKEKEKDNECENIVTANGRLLKRMCPMNNELWKHWKITVKMIINICADNGIFEISTHTHTHIDMMFDA